MCGTIQTYQVSPHPVSFDAPLIGVMRQHMLLLDHSPQHWTHTPVNVASCRRTTRAAVAYRVTTCLELQMYPQGQPSPAWAYFPGRHDHKLQDRSTLRREAVELHPCRALGRRVKRQHRCTICLPIGPRDCRCCRVRPLVVHPLRHPRHLRRPIHLLHLL